MNSQVNKMKKFNPSELKIPNATTIAAREELEAGKGISVKNFKEFLEQLDEEDD